MAVSTRWKGGVASGEGMNGWRVKERGDGRRERGEGGIGKENEVRNGRKSGGMKGKRDTRKDAWRIKNEAPVKSNNEGHNKRRI